MNLAIIQWAARHSVPHQALVELQAIFRLTDAGELPPTVKGNSEAAVQSVVRLEAGRKGVRLWRNNVGALLDSRNVPVRYGLANDSRELNTVVKSGDLIGWRAVLITPAHVGTLIAQFVSRECKRPGWSYKGDDHERAQLKWAEIVMADGGDAGFVTGEGTL